MKYAFIILHYKAFDITADCVNSILALEGSDEAAVIVVDNASGNGSGEALQEAMSFYKVPLEKVLVMLLPWSMNLLFSILRLSTCTPSRYSRAELPFWA